MSDMLNDPGVAEAVVGLFVAALTLITGLLGVAVKRIGTVRHEVQNDHDTNLRDDLTAAIQLVEGNSAQMERLAEQMEAGFRRQDKQHGETHRVLTQETRDRQALDERASREHERIWKRLDDCPRH